ncbi:MAG TPA: MerR family transcriptional regulator [Candidatus Limnocylindrales bacterium]|nr:MerR family transcriptional regulator [Candidatus Limnocylindrales bacterium]
MRDLTRITGLPRETIHFYLTQGLLPKPLKTGRNTAVYGEEHLERLQRIKDLQDRHFLPLKAIKAVLQDGAAEGFTEEQQSLLARLRSSIEPAPASAVRDVALSSIVPSRVTRSDLEAIRRLGVVTVHGKGAGATVTAHDAAVLECWAELTALTRPGEPKVIPELLVAYVEAMDSLVERETRQLTERFSGLPARRLLELIDGSEPPISRLMAVLRSRRIKQIIAGAPAAPVRKG